MTSLPSSNMNSATNSTRPSRIGTPNEKIKRNMQFVEKFKDRISVQNKDGTRTQMMTGEVFASSSSSSDYIRTTTTHRKESAISKNKNIKASFQANSSKNSTKSNDNNNNNNDGALSPSSDSSSSIEDDYPQQTAQTQSPQQPQKPQTTAVLQGAKGRLMAKHGSLMEESSSPVMLLKKKKSMPPNAGTSNNSNNSSKSSSPQKGMKGMNRMNFESLQEDDMVVVHSQNSSSSSSLLGDQVNSEPTSAIGSQRSKNLGKQNIHNKKPSSKVSSTQQTSVTQSPSQISETESQKPKRVKVEYKPFTQKEYKEIIESAAKPLPKGLKPNLEREDIQEAKKKVDRAKKYAENVLKMNKDGTNETTEENEQ